MSVKYYFYNSTLKSWLNFCILHASKFLFENQEDQGKQHANQSITTTTTIHCFQFSINSRILITKRKVRKFSPCQKLEPHFFSLVLEENNNNKDILTWCMVYECYINHLFGINTTTKKTYFPQLNYKKLTRDMFMNILR